MKKIKSKTLIINLFLAFGQKIKATLPQVQPLIKNQSWTPFQSKFCNLIDHPKWNHQYPWAQNSQHQKNDKAKDKAFKTPTNFIFFMIPKLTIPFSENAPLWYNIRCLYSAIQKNKNPLEVINHEEDGDNFSSYVFSLIPGFCVIKTKTEGEQAKILLLNKSAPNIQWQELSIEQGRWVVISKQTLNFLIFTSTSNFDIYIHMTKHRKTNNYTYFEKKCTPETYRINIKTGQLFVLNPNDIWLKNTWQPVIKKGKRVKLIYEINSSPILSP